MTIATPNYDAAVELLDDLTACLEANDLHVPEHRGVTWCGDGLLPGCCDHLVGKLVPNTDPKSCVDDRWQLVVTYAVCAKAFDAQKPWEDYGVDQAAIAQMMEEVIVVFLSCGDCADGRCSRALSVTSFCSAGCDGFKMTFRLS